MVKKPPPVPALLQRLGKLALTPSARFASETAILSFLAAKKGCRPAELLCPTPRKAIAVNAVLPIEDPRSTAARISEARAKGIRTFKVKLSASAGKNLAVLDRIASLVPEPFRLRGDANGCWNPAEARKQLDALAPYGFEYVEDPIANPEPKLLAALRADSPIPVAVDGPAHSVAAIRGLLRARAADVYVLKPMVLGGFAATLQAHREIVEAGGSVVLTASLDGLVARRAAFELACALPGSLLACGFDDSHLRDPSPDGLTIRYGFLSQGEVFHGTALAAL